MKQFTLSKLGMVIMLGALVSACSPVKMPNPDTYQFVPTVPAASTLPTMNTSAPQSILVSELDATAGYDTDKMAYVEHPYQIAYFTKNKWVESPADMLQPLIVADLQNTHHFRAVTAAPFSGFTDWRLDTTLVTLQQNFLTHPSQVELVIDARLVQSSSQRIVAGKRFTIIVPAPSNTPYGGVQAANQAVTLFLQQLKAFVLAV